jgi:DsbC/DsbD-like thiol-disulfide interchange protein
MPHIEYKLVAALSLSILLGATAFAQQQPKRAHARAELVSSVSTIVAGQPFTVALSFDVDPDWHLYWKDPGESGMPPSVKWTLPEGFTAGPLQFPKPEVLQTSAGTNYVHEKQFALLVTITPPATLKPGERVELSGNVSWLECDAEVCLPAKQSVSASVTTGDRAEPVNAERFAKWEEAVKAGEGYDPKKLQ